MLIYALDASFVDANDSGNRSHACAGLLLNVFADKKTKKHV